ncbi:MAG: polysaccharide biosynthesis/export family protein [Candidatus Babeliales bacterium]
MRKSILTYIMICLLTAVAWAQEQPTVVSSSSTPPQAAPVAAVAQAAAPVTAPNAEAVRYTLGPDDLINITVQRHPEFTGDFPVNQEGKIQFRYVGDVEVNGLTKKEVEDKVSKLIGRYVASPEVTVTILEFRSKFYYVIGEVGRPGKIYMRSETTTVRDAIVEAGLPTIAAAMRKCVLITPDKKKPRKKAVDIYAILYGGNLKKNLEMRSGDTLYVPSTVMAKVFRTIAPITQPVTAAAEAQTGITTLNTRPSATVPANQQRY